MRRVLIEETVKGQRFYWDTDKKEYKGILFMKHPFESSSTMQILGLVHDFNFIHSEKGKKSTFSANFIDPNSIQRSNVSVISRSIKSALQEGDHFFIPSGEIVQVLDEDLTAGQLKKIHKY